MCSDRLKNQFLQWQTEHYLLFFPPFILFLLLLQAHKVILGFRNIMTYLGGQSYVFLCLNSMCDLRKCIKTKQNKTKVGKYWISSVSWNWFLSSLKSRNVSTDRYINRLTDLKLHLQYCVLIPFISLSYGYFPSKKRANLMKVAYGICSSRCNVSLHQTFLYL